MKKGNYGPRARARWMYGRVHHSAEDPCTWCRPVAGGAVFVTEILGIPVPINIDWTDCTAGKWLYRPSSGTIAWKGEWSFFDWDGTWTLALENNFDHGCTASFAIGGDFGLGFEQITIWNDGRDAELQMNVATGNTYAMGQIAQIDPPWIFSALWSFRGLTYDEIRADGNDPDDTSPLTWDA